MSKIKELIKFRVAGAPWENEAILLAKLNEVIGVLNKLDEPKPKVVLVKKTTKKSIKEKVGEDSV